MVFAPLSSLLKKEQEIIELARLYQISAFIASIQRFKLFESRR